MWRYSCKNRIKSFAVRDGYIAVGCVDGWIYLFNRRGLLWDKKLYYTYYRGPYTDVNITSIDVDKRYLIFGTDFADGKAYLYTVDGELLWYRQFMCIVGCWERPEDVVAVSLGIDRIGVGSEWLNSFIHLYRVNGKLIYEKRVEGDIRCIRLYENMDIIGTSKYLYINDKVIEVPVYQMALSDKIYVSNDYGLYAIDYDGEIRWYYKARKPIYAVSKEGVAVYDDKLNYISKDEYSYQMIQPNPHF